MSDLQQSGLELQAWLVLNYQHLPSNEFVVGAGDDRFYVYAMHTNTKYERDLPTTWQGTPVEWKFGVGAMRPANAVF